MHRSGGTAPGAGRGGQHAAQLEPPGPGRRRGVVDLGLGAHVAGEQTRPGRWSGCRRRAGPRAAGRRSSPPAGCGCGTPPARPGAGWRRPSRRWSPPRPVAPRPWPGRGRGNRPVRSSIRTCSRSSPILSASNSSYANGALRDPGDSTTSCTPAPSSSVTTSWAQREESPTVVPPLRPVRRGQLPRRLQPSLPERGRVRVGSVLGQPMRARVRAARTGSRPSTATSGSSTRSSLSSRTVFSPHAYGSSGRAAANATPAAIPTEVSRALDTTTGSPISAAIARQARTPPSGCTLRTAMSAAPRRATR